MLNENQIKGKWKEIKGGIRNLWGKITDDELESMKGNFGEISGLVQQRYGESKDTIKEKFDTLLASFDNESDKNRSPSLSSYDRAPLGARTSATSQNQDSDIKTRSKERSAFDEQNFRAGQESIEDPEEASNYSSINSGRSGFGPNKNAEKTFGSENESPTRH